MNGPYTCTMQMAVLHRAAYRSVMWCCTIHRSMVRHTSKGTLLCIAISHTLSHDYLIYTLCNLLYGNIIRRVYILFFKYCNYSIIIIIIIIVLS